MNLKTIAGILFFASWWLVLNASDLPLTNQWLRNKTVSGYLELNPNNRSFYLKKIGFNDEKECMITEIFPNYFSGGSWNLHSVPRQNDGIDHVPAGFNRFKSGKIKNPVMEFTIENVNFELKRCYSLLPGTDIFKLEMEWKSKGENYIDSLNLLFRPAKSYELKSQDGNTLIYTDRSGKKGFAVFADQIHYRDQKFGAVLKPGGIRLPAFNKVLIPKNTVIRMTAYIALFRKTDPEGAARQAKIRVFGKDTGRSVFSWKSEVNISTASLLKTDSGAVFWRLSPELAPEKGYVPSGPSQDWRLSAAGNEFIADQLVITPKKKTTGLRLKLADFKGADNAVIPAALFRFEAVEAVSRPYPYPTNHFSIYGNYMDRLLRVLPESIEPVRNQVFLISGRIPAGQQPGEYFSELTVQSEEFSAKIPIRLKVRCFSLPAEPAFYGDFLISGGGWCNKFSKTPREDVQFCGQDLRALRIHPGKSFTISQTSEGKLYGDPGAALLREMQRDGMQRFRINGVYHCGLFSRRFKPGSQEMDDAMTQFAQTVCQALDKYDLTGRTLWQLGDECHEPKLLKMQIHYSKLTGKAAPALRRFATINGYNPQVAELIRHTDIIVPHTDIFFTRIKPNIDLNGKEIWTYDNSFMNTGIRQNIVRGIAWRSARFGFRGYHQWCVNAWPRHWTPGFDNSGCVYYAALGRETVPQRSLRLVNFALGISDFDYVEILRNEIRRTKDRKAAAAAENELNNILWKMLPCWRDQPENYRIMEQARNRIGDLIESLRKNAW